MSERSGGIIGMDLTITILPVVTKDISISPRFTPYDFLSRCKFSTLTTRQPTWLNFTYLSSHHFRYGRKNTNFTLIRIGLTTSALLAGVQVTYLLDHSGEAVKIRPLRGTLTLIAMQGHQTKTKQKHF